MEEKRKEGNGYTEEFQKMIIWRFEFSTDDTMIGLSEEFDISRSAIYDWVKKRGKRPGANKAISRWTLEYCRKKGVYPEEVKEWKE